MQPSIPSPASATATAGGDNNLVARLLEARGGLDALRGLQEQILNVVGNVQQSIDGLRYMNELAGVLSGNPAPWQANRILAIYECLVGSSYIFAKYMQQSSGVKAIQQAMVRGVTSLLSIDTSAVSPVVNGEWNGTYLRAVNLVAKQAVFRAHMPLLERCCKIASSGNDTEISGKLRCACLEVTGDCYQPFARKARVTCLLKEEDGRQLDECRDLKDTAARLMYKNGDIVESIVYSWVEAAVGTLLDAASNITESSADQLTRLFRVLCAGSSLSREMKKRVESFIKKTTESDHSNQLAAAAISAGLIWSKNPSELLLALAQASSSAQKRITVEMEKRFPSEDIKSKGESGLIALYDFAKEAENQNRDTKLATSIERRIIALSSIDGGNAVAAHLWDRYQCLVSLSDKIRKAGQVTRKIDRQIKEIEKRVGKLADNLGEVLLKEKGYCGIGGKDALLALAVKITDEASAGLVLRNLPYTLVVAECVLAEKILGRVGEIINKLKIKEIEIPDPESRVLVGCKNICCEVLKNEKFRDLWDKALDLRLELFDSPIDLMKDLLDIGSASPALWLKIKAGLIAKKESFAPSLGCDKEKSSTATQSFMEAWQQGLVDWLRGCSPQYVQQVPGVIGALSMLPSAGVEKTVPGVINIRPINKRSPNALDIALCEGLTHLMEEIMTSDNIRNEDGWQAVIVRCFDIIQGASYEDRAAVRVAFACLRQDDGGKASQQGCFSELGRAHLAHIYKEKTPLYDLPLSWKRPFGSIANFFEFLAYRYAIYSSALRFSA